MKTKHKSAAVLTVFDAPMLTTKGRLDIAEWLRRAAKTIMTNSDQLANRWTSRYLYK